ncbi:MAG: hypothetical protein HY302_12355 [Opitutae bacterium]|nr:hypothetical protein [Opitutae bacterium]
MPTLKRILLGLAGLIVLFLVVVAFEPAIFHVERSPVFGSTTATPTGVLLNTYRHVGAWRST